MLFIEMMISIHALLFFSAKLLGRKWLEHAPTVKLQLARILLVSVFLSPLLVQGIEKPVQSQVLQFVSLDTIQEYANKPILKASKMESETEVATFSAMNGMSYWLFFACLFCILMVFRGYGLIQDLRKLKAFVKAGVPYKSCGKLVIKVSHQCHIPFSVSLFNKAYILLPVSLLSSKEHIKIAIAHEGQHHRNGDCVWAYFIEAIRVVFFGNPGVALWHKKINELQELACDEALMTQHKISAYEYGLCLFKVVKTVSQHSESPTQRYACTIGMDSGNHNQDSTFIIRRISMLAQYPFNTSKRSLLGIGLAVSLPICSAYAVSGTISSAQSKAIDISKINPVIQKIATDEIAKAVKQYHAKSGVIVVAEPSSGKIVAFAEKVDGQVSWKTRVFSPGSTIKPFVAATAIDAGLINASKTYDCSSPYVIDGQKFVNADPKVQSLTLMDAITKSENTCLIKVAEEIGSDAMRKKLSEFGFDMKSWWKPNHSQNVQLANAAIGVSIPVTLDSLTKAYMTLANKGHSRTAQVVSKSTADSVTKILQNVVKEGTGKQALIPGIPVAGKTGTLVEQNKGTHLALFGGYLPADAPRYVILVILEEGHKTVNGKTVTQGGEIAAPVFQKMGVQLNAFKTLEG